MPTTSKPRTAATQPRSRWSYKLASIAGIEIRVHATFVILLVVVAMASVAPDGPGLISGLGWITMVFACVVAHEFAHSLVARSKGIDVHEIDLLPIGGVSRMEKLPEDPRDEFQIAIVGPLASMGLSALFAMTALVAGASIWPPDVVEGNLLSRLVWFNLMVALFNLLPAFPLDGGRVLRATLERRRDLEQATHTAATIGRWLAVAMIVAGLLFNIWLLLIGLFVYVGGMAEEAATIIHQRLKGVSVADVMITRPLVLDAGTTVAAAEALLRETGQRDLPVVAPDGAYLGMTSASQLDRANPLADVRSVTEPVPPVDVHAMLDDNRLLESGKVSVAVIDGGQVVGLLLGADVERLLRRALQSDR